MSGLTCLRSPAETATDIRVEPVTDYRRFVDLQETWNLLVEKARIDHPFLSHDWIRSWWDSFGDGKELHILVVKAGEEPVGLAPLMLSSASLFGIKVRQLEFIYNPHTPRCDFIVARSHDAVYRAIWDYFISIRNSWDIIRLPQLATDSGTLAAMQRLALSNGCRAGCWPSTNSPYLTLHGTWEEYFKGLDRKHRSNLRNRLSRLDKLGEIRLQVITAAQDVEAALEEGLEIEAKAWKGEAGTAILCHPELHRFYRTLALRGADRGWLRLSFLTVGGRRIAFDFSLLYSNRIYVLKPGYDPEFARYSPYTSLCCLKLKDAFDQALTEYHFLGMQDGWKLDWTRQLQQYCWLYIFSGRAKARLLHFAKFRVSPFLKRYRLYRRLTEAGTAIWRNRQ